MLAPPPAAGKSSLSGGRKYLYAMIPISILAAISTINTAFPLSKFLSTLKSECPRRTSDSELHVCFRWDQADEADKWYASHPAYAASSEDDDGVCFSPLPGTKGHFFKSVHANQHNATNCPSAHTRHMWSSGWGADFNNVAEGLMYGLDMGVPLQITLAHKDTGEGWHYAAFKEEYRKGRPPVCPTKDMFCYFLPLSPCEPVNLTVYPDQPPSMHNKWKYWDQQFRPWLREYATRPKMWLRRRVLDYKRTHAPKEVRTPCAAIHVRRTDVVLHGDIPRKYFAVEDYLVALSNAGGEHRNILLFTDDANAIEEALTLHPQYHWMFLNKTRHRGSSGGWENQLPSEDPADEVAAILAILKLAQSCDTLVWSASTFGEAIWDSMVSSGQRVVGLRVDEGQNVFDIKHNNSEKMLELRLKNAMNTTKEGKFNHDDGVGLGVPS